MILSDGSSKLFRDTGRSMPTNRQRILTEMLERWDELSSPLASGSGVRGTGELVTLMPHAKDCRIHSSHRTCTCWRKSFAELERLIREMRDDRTNPILRDRLGDKLTCDDGKPLTPRRLWWHLHHWYIAVDHKVAAPPKRTQRNKGKHQLTRQPLDEYGKPLATPRVLRNAEARYQIAKQALDHIAGQWRLDTEPMLPADAYTQAA